MYNTFLILWLVLVKQVLKQISFVAMHLKMNFLTEIGILQCFTRVFVNESGDILRKLTQIFKYLYSYLLWCNSAMSLIVRKSNEYALSLLFNKGVMSCKLPSWFIVQRARLYFLNTEVFSILNLLCFQQIHDFDVSVRLNNGTV